jgi:ubiquinone/menaquinone biosynthesis C-methylase UbiE
MLSLPQIVFATVLFSGVYGLALAQDPILAQNSAAIPKRLTAQPNSLAPYVVSPMSIVDRMLDMAALKSGETIYDLGCGDGRVLISAVRRHGAKAVGVELSPTLARSARESIKRENMEAQARVIEGNLLDTSLADADVVVVYLMTESNDVLKPKFEKELKPTARVISHDFEVRGWKPSKVEKVTVTNRKHTIYVYEMNKR